MAMDKLMAAMSSRAASAAKGSRGAPSTAKNMLSSLGGKRGMDVLLGLNEEQLSKMSPADIKKRLVARGASKTKVNELWPKLQSMLGSSRTVVGNYFGLK